MIDILITLWMDVLVSLQGWRFLIPALSKARSMIFFVNWFIIGEPTVRKKIWLTHVFFSFSPVLSNHRCMYLSKVLHYGLGVTQGQFVVKSTDCNVIELTYFWDYCSCNFLPCCQDEVYVKNQIFVVFLENRLIVERTRCDPRIVLGFWCPSEVTAKWTDDTGIMFLI